ncbi:bifunctional diguanylate cyclase/phosphodiesterase [Actinotalea sp. K2]|uniref:putative bifunctional diguanylate cyclase/phosphodiesterase n=1 Tax=Actinotalea sp. K2 TaxID=2939438 RepID=UPI002016E500|nr:EAL domain-containing protein [Actinotalea sp. K2]MCL3862764.1 EAL domain-containing protein [Actinotalea sp. K2]
MATTTAEPRETSGATTTLLLRYVRAQGGQGAVEKVLARAGVAHLAGDLEQMSHWVGYDTRIRLFEAATEVLDDPGAMFGVGSQAIRHGGSNHVVGLVRAIGSPREIFRQLPRVVARFTTTSTITAVECRSTSAVLHSQLAEGYRHSRLDCSYGQGLIAAVPVLFGLPPAVVVHDECEADGYPACVYRVTWKRYRRFSRQRRQTIDGLEVAALRAQLEDLQLAATDLVGGEDLGAVLERITDRAAAAVLAPAYLLVVDGAPGTDPTIRFNGLTRERAHELADLLQQGQDPGPWAVVVDVRSSRRRYGLLAALFDHGLVASGEDRTLLEAYARHAAAALDLLTALDDSRCEESRATALLALAHDLASAADPQAVAELIAAALPRVVGCRAATVMFWDAVQGELRPVATAGHDEVERDLLLAARITPVGVPELVTMLTHHQPVLLELATASPPLADILRVTGSDCVVAVPLLAGDTLLGVATAGWAGSIAGTPAHAEALARMGGVSDQGATALQNARLLSRIRHQSQHDGLTGLPNRVTLVKQLDDVLRGATAGTVTAVLFCDLDRFKHVNDGLGHAAGDELLRQIAARLREQLREGDIVGRLGGDEFGVVLTEVDDPRRPLDVANRLVERLDEPFRISGHELRVTVSVGVAVHEGPDGRGDRLLAAADSAMYVAKQSGRNQVAVSGQALARRVMPSLEAELAGAAAGGQLRLFYQPVVDITGPDQGRVVGAEALLRWAHPRLGLLAPGAFLPLAEEAGLVSDLDLWAVDAACREWTGWPSPAAGPLRLAVNLAGPTLVDPRLVSVVRSALSRHGLPPGTLHLELVESRSLIDLPGVVERLDELRRLGVRISLDDFGTGYSTLAWLQGLPVDQIKVDRSFISRLADHAPSLAVVRGVLSLARELEIDVVAEGVEDPEQLSVLRSIGCESVQGYLLGRPAPELALSGVPLPLPHQVTTGPPWGPGRSRRR